MFLDEILVFHSRKNVKTRKTAKVDRIFKKTSTVNFLKSYTFFTFINYNFIIQIDSRLVENE